MYILAICSEPIDTELAVTNYRKHEVKISRSVGIKREIGKRILLDNETATV